MEKSEGTIQDNENVRIVYVYKKYPSQARASKKYKETHKEQIKEYANKYYKNKYSNDEEYREYKRKKALERYHAKKQEQMNSQLTV
jgi:hypothetical protein